MLHQRLTVLAEGLDRVSTFWPAADVSIAHDMIAYAHRGARAVVLSASWTVAQKIIFMQLTGAWPDGRDEPWRVLRADRGGYRRY